MRSPRLIVLVAVALLAAGCSPDEVLPRPDVEEARWMVAPEADLGPDSTEVALLVQEVGCASGRPPGQRLRVDTEYRVDQVVVTALVARPEGDQECPSNPVVPFTLQLDEPLGDRVLTNGASSEQAQRPIEIIGDGPGDPDGTSPGGLVIEGQPSERQVFIAESLLVRARDRGDLGDVSDLSPHPDGVGLYLGDRLVRNATPEMLTRDDTWVLDDEGQGYQGFSGPFHVLDTLARAEEPSVAVGPQPHCAADPRPAPAGLEDATRVALRPTRASSCIEWFVVNLYLDGQERVVAVQLDLFGP